MAIEPVTCPECGGPMVSRANKRDGSRFFGCKAYPECRGTRDVEGNTRQPKPDRDDDRERDPERWKRRYD